MRAVPKISTFETLQNGEMVVRGTQLALASSPPIGDLIKDHSQFPNSGKRGIHISLRLTNPVNPSQGPSWC